MKTPVPVRATSVREVPVLCRKCLKPQMIPVTARNVWEDHDVPYVCPRCVATRIHQAVADSNVAALDAFTNAYKIARLANQSFALPPLR